ncbi:MAG TPA: PAS domain S-box protein, partial [Mucilaginibacter sp.]|nr:PAS domain S-box protein [Mucilaginibacter sp.]
EIFGYEPHELINTPNSPIEMIINDEDRATVRENVYARYRGEISNVHYEVRGKKKDGSTNWVEFYGSRVILGDEPTIIGSMLDITERKFAEELILREKALSDTIINSLPGVFYLLNDKGKFLRCNRNLETVTGYTSQEIEGLSAKDMIAEEDREIVSKAVEKVFKEGYAMVEAKGVTKDGTRIPYLFTGTSIIYENQLCLLGTGIDISSRIKAEEELRLSEQKYKLLFDSNPVPLWMIAKDDLSIIAVNDAAANLYGYTKDELLHSSITIVRLEEELKEQQERFRTEIKGATDLGVTRHVKKDGTLMYVQIIASDIVFDGREVRLSLTNDITEKMEAEELLKKSEANLQTILGTTDTAYALFDLDLKLLAFNQKAVQFAMEQYDHIPEKGDRIADYFPKDRFPQFMHLAGEVLKGKHINYEVPYPQATGTEFWYDVRLFPITNANKDILGLMMALYDITERKNTERDLKDAYERIQGHINSIKDMVWKQSHLIRSPLANLKALADMLKEHPTDTEVLDHFHTELNRMDAIIIEMAEDASEHGISD